MEIAPSVLSLDYSKFSEQLNILNKNVRYLHFDVMDGHFVPNITFGPDILKSFKKSSNLFLDVHLMILNPKFYIDKFIEAGADAITFHFEALNYDIDKSYELINYIHNKNIKAGISIKPMTDIESIEPLLKHLDLVLVMSVEPGFGGQEFIESSLDKIRYLKKYKDFNKLEYLIEIDGGINDKTAFLCKEAGADILVAGSYVFKGDIQTNINNLKLSVK